MNLPPELSFLSGFYEDPKDAYRTAWWLLSEFDSKIWRYNFCLKEQKTIDWSITLSDHSCLTDEKNKILLNSLKYLLTSTTRSYSGQRSETNSPSCQLAKFYKTLHVIDYLLLHDTTLKISTYGLEGLSSNTLKHILSEFSKSNDSAEFVYDWTKAITQFCLITHENTNPAEIANILKNRPQLSIITSEQEDNNTLIVPLDIIPEIRAALFLNGYYYGSTGQGFAPNARKISEIIYRDTLKGRCDSKPTVEILRFRMNGTDYYREFNGMPIKTGDSNIMGVTAYRAYRIILYNLGTLHEVGLPAPNTNDLMEILSFEVDLATDGRFSTLPSDIVFKSFRSAVEFHIEYGEKIIIGFCRLALECRRLKCAPNDLTDEQVMKIVGTSLLELGVRKLGLSCRKKGIARNMSVKSNKKLHFQKLRSNSTVLELVQVYIGAVQLVVGALTARRQGELIELHSINCLDTTEQWLIFQNRKSTKGLFGYRQTEARPIEAIAVRMIKNLIRMQKILKRIGYIKDLTFLFSTPHSLGLVGLTEPISSIYNRNLDIFCDYFETKVSPCGKRYYIRQHQFRRFFALLFFHSSSFGGLDTLRWMLGHTDLKHLWNYITETIDGAVLRGAKAQFIAENLHNNDTQSFGSLAVLLKDKYGTDNFSIVDSIELEEYIETLMIEQKIDIQPDFFEDENGQHLRIIVKVIEKRNG